MNKKLFVVFAAVLIAVGMIAPEVAAQPDELTVWASSGEEEDWVRSVAEQYEEETGIEINIIPQPEIDQMEQLSLDGPAGEGADVVGYPHDMLGQSHMQGLLTPIEEFVDTDYIWDNYSDEAISALVYDGQVYGIPYDYQTTTLVYNKDILPEVPETWEELMDWAEDYNNPDQDRYGFLFDIQNFYYSYGFFGGYGAYVFGEENGEFDVYDIGLDTPEAIEAGEFLKQFRDRGLIPQGVDYDSVTGLFEQELVGAIIDGPWSIAGYRGATVGQNDNIGVAPMPKLPNGEYPEPFITVKGYYVSSFSDHQEAAADFIKFLTDAERSMNHYLTNNIMVPHVEVLESEEMANDEYLEGFVQQIERGATPMPSIPEMGHVWDPMENAVTFILRGRAPASEALPMIVNQIEDSIRQVRGD